MVSLSYSQFTFCTQDSSGQRHQKPELGQKWQSQQWRGLEKTELCKTLGGCFHEDFWRNCTKNNLQGLKKLLCKIWWWALNVFTFSTRTKDRGKR